MLYTPFLFLAALATGEATTPSGAVVDAGGHSVPEATVVLAEGPRASRGISQEAPRAAPRATDELASATSDGAGKFTVSLPEEVPEVAGQRTRLTVWAATDIVTSVVLLVVLTPGRRHAEREPAAGCNLAIAAEDVQVIRDCVVELGCAPLSAQKRDPVWRTLAR